MHLRSCTASGQIYGRHGSVELALYVMLVDEAHRSTHMSRLFCATWK